MSKKHVTYIDAAKFQEIIGASGLPIEEKKGWVRVCGPKGRSVYVPKTKTVGRVDISWGQHSATQGVLNFDESERFGSVHCGLDMSLSEQTVLGAFEAVLAEMAALPPRDTTRRMRSKGPSDAVGWTSLPSQQPSSAE